MSRNAIAAVSIALLLAIAALAGVAQFNATGKSAEISAAELPGEARDTLALIRGGGPFPYTKDGAVFSNREGRLPERERGYYREYTVKTPGNRSRGARRIVAGEAGDYWYTEDHYATFRRIRP